MPLMNFWVHIAHGKLILTWDLENKENIKQEVFGYMFYARDDS